MASFNGSDQESTIEVVTPPTITKKGRASKVTPKAAGEGGGENGESFSSTEVRLLIEMLSTLGESSNGIKINWAAITEKLDLPSTGATSKRAERLLKRFDLKMSDITGGGRNGRTPKKAEGEATPGGKRKTGGGQDALETPTKRRGRAKAAVKTDDSPQGGGRAGLAKETSRVEVLVKSEKAGKDEYETADEDVFNN